MCARIQPGRVCKDLNCPKVSNAHNIKLAVVQFRVRRNLHSTAKVSRVSYAKIGKLQMLFVFVIQLNYYSCRARFQRCLHHCNAEGKTSGHQLPTIITSPLRATFFYTLDNFSAHTKGRDAQEVTSNLMAVT